MKISIGIDQSYKRTGLTISSKENDKSKSKVVKSMSFNYRGCECDTDKRNYMRGKLHHVFKKILSEVKSESLEIIVVTERIRIASQGFISMNYIINTGALVATIIDVAKEYNIPVYSVDTRSWKSKIVGNSKARIIEVEISRGKNKGKMRKVKDTKSETLEYVKNKLNIDCGDNDDKADSICISLYGLLPQSKQNLKLEE